MKMNESKTMGAKIAEARKGHGLTQEQLAEMLEVTRQSVSRWESDSAYPETEKLIKLSKLLDLDLNYLLKDGSSDNKDDSTEKDVNDSFRAFPLYGFFKSFHYEYKSKHCLGNLPLVHVNIGMGVYKARGVIAIGNIAVGLLSIGFLSIGLLSFGILAIGLLAIGVFSAGFFAAGAVSLGVIAAGAIAVGLMAFGAVSVGLFSFGALSVGMYVSVGDVAYGGISIGMTSANGSILSFVSGEKNTLIYDRAEVMVAIDQYVPKFWIWFISICKAIL